MRMREGLTPLSDLLRVLRVADVVVAQERIPGRVRVVAHVRAA
jgi:hypothetical protein